MKDTWASRDLPVLDAVVTALEDEFRVSAEQIAAATGLDPEDVVRAFYALQREYTGEVQASLAGRPASTYIRDVTAEARRVVGQWPTAESLVDQLAAGFEQAAERESDPEQKSRLREMARGLAGFANAVAVNVTSQVIGQHIPR